MSNLELDSADSTNMLAAMITSSPNRSTSTPAEVAQAETIRSAMSFSNLLAGPETAAAPDASSAPLAPPSTPTKSATSIKEETASPDTAMVDTIEPDDFDEAQDDAEDVPDSLREFVCVNDEHTRCQTGQYTKDLSRKVISDHFGRNKACTRDITDWPLFCRKHYQRATYNKEKWQLRKVDLILRQFHKIESEFPGTTYDIAFKKSEEARLNQYSRQVASGLSNEDAALNVEPADSKHFEAPIDILRELDQWLGRGKSHEEVQKIVDVIKQMLEEKESSQVPSIEFLPQLPGKPASPKKTPSKARTPKSPKTPRTPKTPKTPKTPTRVSDKGSIRKPNQK